MSLEHEVKSALNGLGQGSINPLDSLLSAKQESDKRNYPAKHAILRKLIKQSPNDFTIDSEVGDIYGVTHIPTGFRIHMPRGEAPAGLKKQASRALTVAPSDNAGLSALVAGTAAEPYAEHYSGPSEWLDELPSTAITRPSEGPFWKGDLSSTLSSWADRGLERRQLANQHARWYRMIQSAVAKREGISARNRNMIVNFLNQPTATVDSPWGKQQTGPVIDMPHLSNGYGHLVGSGGGPGAEWDRGTGGIFYDMVRRNPDGWKLDKSDGNESTWVDRFTGMRYTVPDAPSPANRNSVIMEHPTMNEWANTQRENRGRPVRS